VRMLLPYVRDGLTDDDLDAAYAWPGDPERAPWLRANMVATVDGAARAPDGLSARISSDADRQVFGRLRALADVVLVGAGTVRSEGYRPARVRSHLAVRRAAANQTPVPAIAVVSRSLHLDLAAPLFTEAQVRTIVITSASSDRAARARTAAVADVIVAVGDDVDLPAAVADLRDRGLARVHAEGGPSLLGDLAANRLLDELLLTVTPALAGGGYADRRPIDRILAGAVLDGAPRPLRLHHLLEDDGSLFLSYRTAT
jgi:riboflavin biosynthesis pyrimidine reductase